MKLFLCRFALVVASIALSASVTAAPLILDGASKCPSVAPESAPDGAFFRACYVLEASGLTNALVLEKFTADGALEPGFALSGRATLASLSRGDAVSCGGIPKCRSVYFAPDGKILVLAAGFLYGFTASGAPDPAYGIGGRGDRLYASDSPRFGSLPSIDTLADGRIIGLSVKGQFALGSGQNAETNPTFIARRILANGHADAAFGVNHDGVVDYVALPLIEALNKQAIAVAWSLQTDDSLEVSYYEARNPFNPSVVVARQAAHEGSITVLSGQALPVRAHAYYVSVFGVNSGSSLQLLGDGRFLTFPVNAGTSPQTTRREQLVARFTPSGALDKTFGNAGVQSFKNPFLSGEAPVPAGCRLVSDDHIALEADGSIVYEYVDRYLAANVRGSVPCSGEAISFAAKLTPGGKFDSKFPQWIDLATSGAVINARSSVWNVVEYYNANLDRYFMSPHPAEQAAIDASTSLRRDGWRKTGKTFAVWDPASAISATSSACRFSLVGTTVVRSFYDSVLQDECAGLQQLDSATPDGQRAWRYDRESFRATPTSNGACPSTLTPIYVVYNRGFERGIDLSFRYIYAQDDLNVMLSRGWVGHPSPQFCALPS